MHSSGLLRGCSRHKDAVLPLLFVIKEKVSFGLLSLIASIFSSFQHSQWSHLLLLRASTSLYVLTSDPANRGFMTLIRKQVPTFFASQSASNYDPVNNPLDLETQTKHSLFLVKGGVRGLVILGSTGEAIHLTNKERNELIQSQRTELDNAGFNDRPIIAGTATQNVQETLIQLEDAKKAGAEYGMVLTPGYFASAASQQGIAKWFEAVADKSPIPIMMYVSSPT
jgi:hypothetical protein